MKVNPSAILRIDSERSRTVNVLGVKIDDISKSEALKKIEQFLASKGDAFRGYIVTPNPEIIVSAQKDNDLLNALNDADLSIPDGIGLKFAGVKNRITGIELMLDLVRLASEKGYSVGFIGGKEGVAQKTAEVLCRRYPNLKVSFADSGGEMNSEGKLLKYPKKLKLLNCDILFVAFGHGKQEKWIAKNLPNLPVRVAMVVGGSFDYISGKIPRAPVFIRKLGFEWLFRLVVQPWRLKRQLALLKFIFLVI